MPTMKTGLILLAMGGCLMGGGCKRPAGGFSAEPKSEEEKTFYTIGVDIGRTLEDFNPSPAELQMVYAGLDDHMNHRPLKVDFDKNRPKIAEMSAARRRIVADLHRAKGKAALEEASKQPGARLLPSGMVIRSLRPGTGPAPKRSDTVTVHYEGRSLDGKLFDTSANNKGPVELKVQETVPCWINGLLEMKAGEKARFTCPAELIAIGGHAPGGLHEGAAAVYDVELIEVKAAP